MYSTFLSLHQNAGTCTCSITRIHLGTLLNACRRLTGRRRNCLIKMLFLFSLCTESIKVYTITAEPLMSHELFSIVFKILLPFWALSVQGSRLILPTGRTFATNFLSWLHKDIIWSHLFLIQHLINQCMLMNFYHSYMDICSTFNPFFFISISFDLHFVNREFLFSCPFTFTFKFPILVSDLTRKENCLFCLYLYTFHFLRLKQKMDLLVFLIKKHNYK